MVSTATAMVPVLQWILRIKDTLPGDNTNSAVLSFVRDVIINVLF